MPDGQQEKKEERKRKGFRKEPADGQKSGQKKNREMVKPGRREPGTGLVRHHDCCSCPARRFRSCVPGSGLLGFPY
jgi:hypothetical protein